MKLTLLSVCVFAVFCVLAKADSSVDGARERFLSLVDLGKQKVLDSVGKVKSDAFDSWSESQIKAWADVHGLDVPQTGKIDELRAFARRNKHLLEQDVEEYSKSAAHKLTSAINWANKEVYDAHGRVRADVFNSWSKSELKAWADAHGLPVPQHGKKDELAAFARRHRGLIEQDWENYKRLASESAKDKLYKYLDFANKQFYDAAGNIREDVFDTWSNSQLKAWADTHGLPVPQHDRKDEIQAFARRHRKLLKQDIEDFTNRAADQATPFLSKATAYFSDAGNRFFESSVSLWSESRLKSFLEARGVIAPPKTTKDKLVDLVRANRKKHVLDTSAWSFESWSKEDIEKWLNAQGKKAQGSRDELVKSAQDYYSSAKEAGGETYSSVVDSISKYWGDAKAASFDKWSDSDLKAYLDTYGIKTYQGTKRNELLAKARSQYHLYTHGADPEGWGRVRDHFVDSGRQAISGASGCAKGALNRLSEWYHNAILYFRQDL